MRSYLDVIASKQRTADAAGFTATVDDPWLSPFQQHAVRWALMGGRRALFMDTGLGKTRMELAFADRVERHLGERVLILAPLAVGAQTVREADRIGLGGVVFAQHPGDAGSARIVVTNYDSLHHWDHVTVGAAVLDESSILKSFMGKMRRQLTERFTATPCKLAATATPAPNDYDELGNHSEWLGLMPLSTMLAQFFVNDSSETGTWQLRGHAIRPFWDWVASWALCAGLPSDVGDYPDDGYRLPRLHMERHVVTVDLSEGRAAGTLFRTGNMSATGVHAEKRLTTADRAAKVAEIVASEPDEPWIVWCETDYEAAALMERMPHAVEVSGSMKPEVKTERLLGFTDRGGILVTKPKIAGFGMNWQHCARMVISGGTYSYESVYQLIRRCWRFGQRREVVVHFVMAYTEQHMWQVVSGKADKHDAMKQAMFAASRRAQRIGTKLSPYNPTHIGRLPSWLRSESK